ncbi:hypothetical protein T07_12996 [Trichinella nelsoni]|uniref:Uncharacterized protein n=1 Tax=Trichinella nelsoni TaxID=6336 RepID=A0A0V0S499_9BILA|nr:hypothetical protein T07_12996 [Trichinella nelsoni]
MRHSTQARVEPIPAPHTSSLQRELDCCSSCFFGYFASAIFAFSTLLACPSQQCLGATLKHFPHSTAGCTLVELSYGGFVPIATGASFGWSARLTGVQADWTRYVGELEESQRVWTELALNELAVWSSLLLCSLTRSPPAFEITAGHQIVPRGRSVSHCCSSQLME